MAKLNISSANDERSMEEDKEEEEEEFNDAMEREEDNEVDTTNVVQRGDLTDLSFDVDLDSEDEEGGAFSEDDLSELPGDHSLDQDYDTASEVSSGRFAADHANKFAEPISFKELLWNTAGPSPLHTQRTRTTASQWCHRRRWQSRCLVWAPAR